MKVLVTGATGLIGSAVVTELLARGHEARALVRATSDLSNLDATRVELVLGDVLDRPAVERALAGCDAVIHTAGLADVRADRKRLLAVNAGGVEVVMGAALAARVARAVLTSSTAVLGGGRVPRVMDEETTSSAETLGLGYFISKKRGEETAFEFAARGLPLVVVRPSVVLGPGDIYRSSASIVAALARRRLPVYVQGGASYCDVRDVARGHVTALERGRVGEAYILGGHNLLMDEMVGRVCRMAGVAPPLRVPYAAAAATLRAMGWLRALGGPAPSVHPDLLLASSLYTFVTSAKAQRELGYAIRPFDDTVRDTLRWFLKKRKLRPTTRELEALVEG
jgi:dihydroflavonol-4-reductase